MNRDRQKEIRRAKHIQKTLGTWTAARFMCKRGWSLEAAHYVLLRG
jgi:hypothetical protein